MSSYIYRKYEEKKGFEEFQAEIYNSVAKKYNATQVTAEAIEKRLHDHKPEQDRNGMTFVFDNNDRAVAYIQYREYANGKVRIGYPWSVEGTPIEVKDKLFYDLFDYLKSKYSTTKKFYLGFLNYTFTGVLDDVQNHYHFKEDTSISAYTLDLNKALSVTLPDNYSYKEATKEDIEQLVSIALADKETSRLGRDGIIDFFNSRFFIEENKERSSIILLKNKIPIATVSVLKMKERGKEYFSVRLTAIKEGEEASYQYLLSATAKVLSAKNMKESFSFNFTKIQENREESLKKIGGEFITRSLEFAIELE